MNKTFRTGATLGALAACALLLGDVAQAQTPMPYVFNNATTPYTQNFNSGTYSTTTNNTATVSSIGIPELVSNIPTYRAGNGSSATGSLFAYSEANAPADYAIGSVASGTAPNDNIQYGLRFYNNTGENIQSFNLSYFGEQYRNGGNTTPQKLDFSYIIASAAITPSSNTFAPGTYTDVDLLDFISPVTGATAADLDGNAAANRVAISQKVAGLNWGNGQYLFIKWTDVNDTGNDHGLAIDDVNFSVEIPEPGTFALALLGVGPLGVMAVRRRKAMRK